MIDQRCPSQQIFETLEIGATMSSADLEIGSVIRMFDDSLLIGGDPGVPICDVTIRILESTDRDTFLRLVENAKLDSSRFSSFLGGQGSMRFYRVEQVEA